MITPAAKTFYKRPLPVGCVPFASAQGRELFQEAMAAGTMAGYWKQDDETARVIREGGWVRSGDAGMLDNDGYPVFEKLRGHIVTGPTGTNVNDLYLLLAL